MFMGSLFIWGNWPPVVVLNSSMAGLGNPVPMGIVPIRNYASFTSLLVSRYFINS